MLTSRPRLRGRVFRDTVSGYLLISPAALFLLLFSFIAIVVSLVISFSDWSPLRDNWSLVGIDNYKRAFANERFWKSFRNTGQYVMFLVPGVVLTSLALALIGNHARKLRSVFRTLFFIPVITPGVVVALIWIWMFRSDGGVNEVLKYFGITGPNWLLSAFWAMPAIIIMTIWSLIGYYMIIFLAGLADIPEVFYEAAKVDGANRVQTFPPYNFAASAQSTHLCSCHACDRGLAGFYTDVRNDPGRTGKRDRKRPVVDLLQWIPTI